MLHGCGGLRVYCTLPSPVVGVLERISHLSHAQNAQQQLLIHLRFNALEAFYLVHQVDRLSVKRLDLL